MPAQVATRSTNARDQSAANTMSVDAGKNWHRSHCVCRQRGCVGESRLRGSQASLNSNCQKTGESILSPTTRHIARNVVVNAFQQYEWFAGLAMAKFERRCLIIRACTSTVAWNSACSLEICNVRLLKSGASRQEKTSACNRNGAAADEHFRDSVVLERCADVNATGTQHLDSLLDDDRLFARREAVTNKVSDGAT